MLFTIVLAFCQDSRSSNDSMSVMGIPQFGVKQTVDLILYTRTSEVSINANNATNATNANNAIDSPSVFYHVDTGIFDLLFRDLLFN